jgi:hypothetical protein
MLQYYKAFENNKIEPCENSQDPEDMSISDMSIDTSVLSVFRKPSFNKFNTGNGRDVNLKQSVFKEEESFISKNPIGTQFKANSMSAFSASAIKSTNPVRSTDTTPSSKEVRYHKKWRAKNGSTTEEAKTNPDMEPCSENWTTDAGMQNILLIYSCRHVCIFILLSSTQFNLLIKLVHYCIVIISDI